MIIWTYTNGPDGPRWTADGTVVELLTDGTFRVVGLTDVYDTLREAKGRAERWAGVLAGAINGNAKDRSEVLANAAKNCGTALIEKWTVHLKDGQGRFIGRQPAYPEAEWHAGREG